MELSKEKKRKKMMALGILLVILVGCIYFATYYLINSL